MAPEHVVIAPLLAALATAVLTLLLRPYRRVQRAVSLLGGLAYAGGVAVLFQRVAESGTTVYQLSNWDAPFGIVLVADALSVFMLALAAVVSLAALVFSVEYLDDGDQQLSYHALFHFMIVGVTGAFLTGDIFNLFVWFEVMLMSSYVLVAFYSGPEHTKAALQYAVLNLVGSAVMLLAIGGIYSVTGAGAARYAAGTQNWNGTMPAFSAKTANSTAESPSTAGTDPSMPYWAGAASRRVMSAMFSVPVTE